MAKKTRKKESPRAQIKRLTQTVQTLNEENRLRRDLEDQVADLKEQLQYVNLQAGNNSDLVMRTMASLQEVTQGAMLMQTTICKLLERLVPDPAAKPAVPPTDE